MTSTAEKPTLERTFQILCAQIKKHDSQKKIMAHLRAVTGRSIALPVYHNDASISEETKMELYTDCVKAIVTNNYSALQGQTKEEGDTRIDPVEVARSVQPKTAAQATTPKPPPESTIETVPPVTPKVNNEIVRNSTESDLGVLLLNALRAVIEPMVIQIVDERMLATIDKTSDAVVKGLSNGHFPTDRVEQIVNEVLKKRFS